MGYLVGYNSRNIFRILLLEKGLVIGTRDLTFDETLFLDKNKRLIPFEDPILQVDFSMIPSVPDYLLENKTPPVRHNWSSSQINEDENIYSEANNHVAEVDHSPVRSPKNVDVSDPNNSSYSWLPTSDELTVKDSLES